MTRANRKVTVRHAPPAQRRAPGRIMGLYAADSGVSQPRRSSPTRSELNAMLREAVVNTARMQQS